MLFALRYNFFILPSIFGPQVTIHDIEFYGDELQIPVPVSQRVWMPFTLSELVPMSLALRDVALGLVELAFPESRPVVKEEYQQAIQ